MQVHLHVRNIDGPLLSVTATADWAQLPFYQGESACKEHTFVFVCFTTQQWLLLFWQTSVNCSMFTSLVGELQNIFYDSEKLCRSRCSKSTHCELKKCLFRTAGGLYGPCSVNADLLGSLKVVSSLLALTDFLPRPLPLVEQFCLWWSLRMSSEVIYIQFIFSWHIKEYLNFQRFAS